MAGLEVLAMHQVIPHGQQALHGVDIRACKNANRTGHRVQRRRKLHDVVCDFLGHAVENVASVAVRGVQKITDHREDPVNTLLARIDNSVQLLGQPVQWRCKLHYVVCHFLGHAVENVASVAVRGVQKITDHRENSVDTLLACIDNRMKLMRQEVHGRCEGHDVVCHKLGHAVEAVGSVAVGGVQQGVYHLEQPVDRLLGMSGNALYWFWKPVQRGLELHDVSCDTFGHAVEGVASVAVGGVQQMIRHVYEPVDHLLTCPSNPPDLMRQVVQRIRQRDACFRPAGLEEPE